LGTLAFKFDFYEMEIDDCIGNSGKHWLTKYYFQLLPHTGLNAEGQVEGTMVAIAHTAFVQSTLQKTARDQVNIRGIGVCGTVVIVVTAVMG
jgi:hypothetical protein